MSQEPRRFYRTSLRQGLGRFLRVFNEIRITAFFYALTVCVIILAAFSIAKAIYRGIQWKRCISAFLRRFGGSILLLSLLVALFNMAAQHSVVLEYLIFMVMWAQLETTIVLWRIKTVLHISFRAVDCRQPNDLTSHLCRRLGRVYVCMGDSGKLAKSSFSSKSSSFSFLNLYV